MPLDPTVRSRVTEKIESYEGRINHLYLDSRGKVTVGIGHLVPSSSAMISLVMYPWDKPNKIASFQEKKEEFETISKLNSGYRASWYKQHTSLFMKEVDINNQRNQHIDNFYRELVNIYSKSNGYKNNFDDYSENIQVALFDMIFNLGATRLQRIFVNFNAAVKSEDWDTAAKESYRRDISEERNTFVKRLF